MEKKGDEMNKTGSLRRQTHTDMLFQHLNSQRDLSNGGLGMDDSSYADALPQSGSQSHRDYGKQ